MFGHGGVCASGTIDELMKSDNEDVFAFFHRIAEPRAITGGGMAEIATR